MDICRERGNEQTKQIYLLSWPQIVLSCKLTEEERIELSIQAFQ